MDEVSVLKKVLVLNLTLLYLVGLFALLWISEIMETHSYISLHAKNIITYHLPNY